MEDEAGFAAFVRDRAPALYRYGYVLTGSAHDADDLVQEALIRLRGAWSRVRRRDDPIGYVRTTMARLHVSMWRRRRHEVLRADVPDTGAGDPAMDRVVDDEPVWRALAALPPRQRAVLVLRFYENLSDAQIAEVLGVSRGTVRSQSARGMDKVRASWPATTPGLIHGGLS